MSLRRIGDVAKALDEPTHVLRYWEQEFGLKPARTRNGQRYYDAQQAQQLYQIRTLVRVIGFTLWGAKRWMKMTSPDKGLELRLMAGGER